MPQAEVVLLDPADNGAYCDLLSRLWGTAQEVLIVEHDMGVHGEVLPQLEDCPSWWCAFRYRVEDVYLAALGCTRFRAELMQAEPDLMEQVAQVADSGMEARHWKRLDVRILDALRARSYRRCEHLPPVQHFHYEVPSAYAGVPWMKEK